MDLNKKEKYIKDVLSNEKYDLDTQALWKNIEPRVESKDRDRKWVIFFFLGALSMGAIWMLSNMLGTEMAPAQVIERNMTQTNNELHTQPTIKEHTGGERGEIELGESIRSNESVVPHSSSSKDLEPKKNAITNNTKKVNTLFSSSERKEETGFEKESAGISRNVLPNKSTVHEETALNSLNQPTERIVLLPVISQIGRIDPIGLSARRLIDISPEQAEVIIPHRNWSWMPFIQFHAGVITSQVSSDQLPSDALLSAGEFEKESGVYGFSGTLNIGWERHDGWYYGLGLDFTQSAIRYLNTDNVLELESSSGVEAIYINRNGQTTTIPGTVNENKITSYNISWYRQHRHINFEVLMGKRLINTSRFNISADAGLMYGISQVHSGYYFIDANNGFVKFDRGDDHPYSDSGNMKFRSTLSFNYKLKHCSVGLQALYRYDLNGITKSNNFYKTRNTDFGLRLGLTYFPNW